MEADSLFLSVLEWNVDENNAIVLKRRFNQANDTNIIILGL